MSYKYGINLMVWSGRIGQPELERLPAIKAMGYDGVELPVFDAEAIDVAAVRQALVRAELACTVSTSLPTDLNLVDADTADRGVSFLRQIIDAAAALGSPIVCGPLALPVGERRGRGYTNEEWDRCVLALRLLSEYADSRGVKLAFEPLNRFETFLLNTVAAGVQLCEEVDMPSFGLLLDTFHMHIEEKSTPSAIRHAGARIKHFHASENDRGVVGAGQVPWSEVFQSLRDVDYEKWVVVESFNSVIPELAGATCVWRPLAESPDALARESLAFLQSIT